MVIAYVVEFVPRWAIVAPGTATEFERAAYQIVRMLAVPTWPCNSSLSLCTPCAAADCGTANQKRIWEAYRVILIGKKQCSNGRSATTTSAAEVSTFSSLRTARRDASPEASSVLERIASCCGAHSAHVSPRQRQRSPVPNIIGRVLAEAPRDRHPCARVIISTLWSGRLSCSKPSACCGLPFLAVF